jgi:hypothetical protein
LLLQNVKTRREAAVSIFNLTNQTVRLHHVMVVVHRAHGFRFVIYTADHQPAHVHVTGAGQAKINLLGPRGAPEVVYSIGISRSDMRRLENEASLHQARFMAEWERLHGSS